jgi:hypothetical protein
MKITKDYSVIGSIRVEVPVRVKLRKDKATEVNGPVVRVQ